MTGTLRVNQITSQSGSGSISIPSGNTLRQDGLTVQVIQKIFSESTSTATAQTYVVANNANLQITTKLANSRILVMFTGQGYGDGTTGLNLGLQRVVSGVTTRLIGVDGSSGDAWSGAGYQTTSYTIHKQFLDNLQVPAGTTIRYDMLLGRWTSGTAFLNYPGFPLTSSITLMEIAQ